MSDDDDLRFGDVNGGDSGGTGGNVGSDFDVEPLLVGGFVAVIVLFTQPLSSLMMNIVCALFMAFAGVIGSFAT